MDFWLYVLLILSFFVSFGFWELQMTHMFQLNSYKPDVQFKWLCKNMRSVLPKWIISLSIIPIIIFLHKSHNSIGLTVAAVIFIILAYVNKPTTTAKKPLIYTNRVKRLLLTGIIIELAIVAIAIIFREHNHRIALSVLLTTGYIATPFITFAANFINMPIEKSINRRFINDAKRIIKSMPDLTVIGITGSYGKTSVKYYLTKLLSEKYNVLMTPESYNTTLGVVRTIRENLRATHEVFVCEMGARNIGDIKEICDIVHPKYGIITAIGPQHLESFKTLDNIKKTKFELANSLPNNGIAFLNGDDENIKSVSYNGSSITYGLDGNGNYTAFNLSLSSAGTSFYVRTPSGETAEFSTRLIGRHNVLNVIGAIAVAHTLGISLVSLKMPVKKLEPAPHRLQLINNGSDLIIDDAYNSNPNGSRVALNTLSMFEGTKILVTPGMVELGDKQDEYNCEFGENAANVCDFVILVGEKQTESIYKGLLNKKYSQQKIFVVDAIQDAFSVIHNKLNGNEKKIILLENDLPDNF
ncbi:MAG: UDP-N-acetylmuramoyl-tripeptide--D-alanyl-D-alanine ligase [Bacillota bacterium]|nr:UDP-N-acetylmuramoyl-tripeptide--D-alanyl-D-alanine ligase [Bacillota bacterium]